MFDQIKEHKIFYIALIVAILLANPLFFNRHYDGNILSLFNPLSYQSFNEAEPGALHSYTYLPIAPIILKSLLIYIPIAGMLIFLIKKPALKISLAIIISILLFYLLELGCFGGCPESPLPLKIPLEIFSFMLPLIIIIENYKDRAKSLCYSALIAIIAILFAVNVYVADATSDNLYIHSTYQKIATHQYSDTQSMIGACKSIDAGSSTDFVADGCIHTLALTTNDAKVCDSIKEAKFIRTCTSTVESKILGEQTKIEIAKCKQQADTTNKISCIRKAFINECQQFANADDRTACNNHTNLDDSLIMQSYPEVFSS